MSKISVILPCYNKEKTISTTLNSLINQSVFNDMEVVCVNDCSTDNTAKIISDYVSKYKNIKLYNNKVNKQVFGTRKKGIKHATGKYIGFLDPDDWVDSTYFEEMYKAAESSQADIIQNLSVIKWYSKNKEEPAKPSLFPSLITGKYNIDKEFIKYQICGSWCTLWNRLFKSEIIKEVVRIPTCEITMMEDTLILFDCCFRSHAIYTIETSSKLYYNVSNDVDHLSNNKSDKYKNSILMVFSLLDTIIMETNNYQYYDIIKDYRKGYYNLMTNEYNKLFTKFENFNHKTQYCIPRYKLGEMNKLKLRIEIIKETF